MRALLAVVAMCACAAVLLRTAILAIEVLPYVAIGCALALLIRSRRQRHRAPVRQQAYRQIPPSAPRYQAPTGQWVYVPVWVDAPPRPAVPVIDAEGIEEQR